MFNKLFGFRFGVIKRPVVFFDITIDKQPAGRILFELYSDKTPRTAENFRRLWLNQKIKQFQNSVGDAKSTITGKALHYKGSSFHRIIPSFMCQGGDFTHHNGTGGESIYGRTFPDENFVVKHDKQGLLSMANAGPNTNGSQFFITTVACPWLDGKHTVFGEVKDGKQTLNQIEFCGTSQGRPKKSVIIYDCGEIKQE